MATQSAWDSIPDVAEQTELENGPIKVRWTGEDRPRVRRSLVAALEDGWMERAIAVPVMTRQKTNIVIKTEEELDAFKEEFYSRTKWRVRKRIEREIEEQLNGDDGNEEEQERSEAFQRRKEQADLDALMNDIVIPHARKWAQDVWPGGTVDVDEISWFWNTQLTSCAARAYWGTSVPDTMVDGGPPAIGLAPAYYYSHGLDEMLAVVRHELIHIWQRNHENGFNRGGHGKDFKQWIGDMDTHRYCKHWSK